MKIQLCEEPDSYSIIIVTAQMWRGGVECDVPDDQVHRWHQAMLAYEQAQDEMSAAYERTLMMDMDKDAVPQDETDDHR